MLGNDGASSRQASSGDRIGAAFAGRSIQRANPPLQRAPDSGAAFRLCRYSAHAVWAVSPPHPGLTGVSDSCVTMCSTFHRLRE
jgi:hypothetical protein